MATKVLQALEKALDTVEGRKELKTLFDQLETDADGRVDRKEWGKCVAMNRDALVDFFGKASLREINSGFKRIDLDGSDSLTWNEFVVSARVASSKYSSPEFSDGEPDLPAEVPDAIRACMTLLANTRPPNPVKFLANAMLEYGMYTAAGYIVNEEHTAGNNSLEPTGDEYFNPGISIDQVLAYLSEALVSDTAKAELKLLFESLDKDADGRVSSQEWGAAVSTSAELLAKFFGGASEEEILEAFKLIDTDGSDSITWEEFVVEAKIAADSAPDNEEDEPLDLYDKAEQLINGRSRAELEEILRELFAKADVDGNGTLDPEEMAGCLKATGFGFSDEDVARALAVLDLDSDGLVDYLEFVPLAYGLLQEAVVEELVS